MNERLEAARPRPGIKTDTAAAPGGAPVALQVMIVERTPLLVDVEGISTCEQLASPSITVGSGCGWPVSASIISIWTMLPE